MSFYIPVIQKDINENYSFWIYNVILCDKFREKWGNLFTIDDIIGQFSSINLITLKENVEKVLKMFLTNGLICEIHNEVCTVK